MSDSGNTLIIEGVNTEKAIKQLGGRLRSYQKILAAFYKEGERRIADIQHCYDERDIKGYTTFVHGSKSASGNIGAERLSSICAVLEDAGHAEDWGVIAEHHDSAVAEYKRILGNVDAALNDAKGDAAPASVNKDELTALLKNLCDSFDSFDISAINEGCNVLSGYASSPAYSEAIEGILHNKTIGEYEVAVEIITALLEKL